MASILRKLTLRKKKTKPSTTAITLAASGDSSHASEEWKGGRRPQHVLAAATTSGTTETSPLSEGEDEHSRRRRSRSFDKSTTSTSTSINHANTGKHRKTRSVTKFLQEDELQQKTEQPPTTPNNRRRRLSLTKRQDKQETNTASATTSTTTNTTSGKENWSESPATTTPKPALRSRIMENHEIFAPPGAHSAPRHLKSQDTKAQKARERKRALLDRKQQAKRVSDRRKKPAHHATTSPHSKLSSQSTSATSPRAAATAVQSPDDAKQIAQNQETERIAKAAAALDHRGNEFFEHGYYDKAMEAYSRALKLKRRTFHSMLEEADDLLGEETEDHQNNLEQDDMDPKLLVSMATSINNIGYLRQRAGEATPDETMAAYKKSLRIKRKILGNDSLSVGKTLNNIGSVYYLKKEFQESLPAYAEAFQIMQSNLGEGHPDVATVMSNMGDVCLAMTQRDEALERYRVALTIRWNAFGEKDPRTRRLLEKIARIEIGDKMPTPRGTKENGHVYDWDESELYDLDLRPISQELAMLKDQVQADLESVNLLERQMAVGMVKDKLRIVKGMRELSDAQDQSSSILALRSFGSKEEDSSSHAFEEDILTPSVPLTEARRHDAKQRVQMRLERLKSERQGTTMNKEMETSGHSNNNNNHDSFNNNSFSKIQQSPTPTAEPSAFLRTSIYSPSQQRMGLSSLSSKEIQSATQEIKSALKLKKGIDRLRSFEGSGGGERKPPNLTISIPPLVTPETRPSPVTPEAEDLAVVAQVKPVAEDERQASTPTTVQPSKPSTVHPLPLPEEKTQQNEVDVSPSLGVAENGQHSKIIHATWLGEVEG